MTKIYRSKVSPWIFGILTVCILGPLVMLVIAPKSMSENLTVVGLLVGAYVITIWLLLSTRYLMDGDKIHIKSGPISYPSIPLHDIREVRQTNDPLAAPAASLDRLAIRYGGGKRQLISPRDQEDFIDEIIKINPAVKVVRKKKSSALS